METLRAALLGCLLAGGALFGARPPDPRTRAEPAPIVLDGPDAGLGRTSLELVAWFRPVTRPVLVHVEQTGLRLAAPLQPHATRPRPRCRVLAARRRPSDW
jgi:hypothetical protein